MKNVIVNFSFALKQDILVYENGVCTQQLKIKTDNVVNTLRELIKDSNVERVSFVGNKNYSLKFAERLKTDFTNNNIECDFISK